MSRAPSASPVTPDRPPRIRWSVVIALFALATVLRFLYFYLDDLTRGMHDTFVRRALEEGTGNFASALLFPIALLLERRFPVDEGRWRRTWAIHIGGYVLYSVLHTTVIALTRAVLAPSVGIGPYDYGIMSVRYFMEAAQDFFSYATFVGLLTLVRVQQRLRDREVVAVQLERDAATARLEALGLRLQSHFLFNALNTISSAVYDDPAGADEMIGHLGELLRRSLRTNDRAEIPLSEEMETLDAYLAFVRARFGDRLECLVTIDIPALQLGVPALLLQPLVENAVRHGASLEFGRSHVALSATKNGGELHIVVENDVAAEATAPVRIGTGLGATRDRLRLLYGDAADLSVAADRGQFRVALRLPARVVQPSVEPAGEPERARAHR
jgi:two-component system, LytTR family, sensor kinase